MGSAALSLNMLEIRRRVSAGGAIKSWFSSSKFIKAMQRYIYTQDVSKRCQALRFEAFYISTCSSAPMWVNKVKKKNDTHKNNEDFSLSSVSTASRCKEFSLHRSEAEQPDRYPVSCELQSCSKHLQGCSTLAFNQCNQQYLHLSIEGIRFRKKFKKRSTMCFTEFKAVTWGFFFSFSCYLPSCSQCWFFFFFAKSIMNFIHPRSEWRRFDHQVK